MEVYEPSEDSCLLAEAVKKLARGRVLDMGTGSGIQAETALKSRKVKSVTAADINKDCGRNLNEKIKFIQSNLFSSIPRQEFDTIIFNPPYLPQDKGIEDEAIYGGRHGYETLQRFICSCNDYLADSGTVLIVFSSRTNKQKVDEAIAKSCLELEELGQERIFFETLYAYAIRKSPLLRQLEQEGVTSIALFERGNRGVLYKGSYRGKTVVVKAKRKESVAVATIQNEINWLTKLNGVGIGPKLLLSSKENDWFAYEFVEGEFITDFINNCKEKKKLSDAIKQLLLQCRKLDKLGVNKEEMSRPQKHVLIDACGKITMLDFERCRKTQQPKNITQLCQFLAVRHANSLLRQKGMMIDRDKLLEAAQKYKNEQSEENFKKVVTLAS